MAEIVNIVASGDLGVELDLKAVQMDLTLVNTEYRPETHPGLHIRFEETGPLLTLYTSGSYVIMGAKTRSEVNYVFDQLCKLLEQLNIKNGSHQAPPVIQNIIYKVDLGREVDLSALALALNLEDVEYEPEQSPFLYYWPKEHDCVISIPANGEVVISGVQSESEAEAAYSFLETQIESIFGDL